MTDVDWATLQAIAKVGDRIDQRHFLVIAKKYIDSCGTYASEPDDVCFDLVEIDKLDPRHKKTLVKREEK
jgi:hypothetical protein